jgi:hypothetical protein
MGALTRTILSPDAVFRKQLESMTQWPQKQDAEVPAAICILGTSFDPENGPSPRMRARLQLAVSLIRNATVPTRVIASGGAIGTGGHLVTEAQLIDTTLRKLGTPKVYREDFSQESVGNIALTALGLLQPLRTREVKFITDELHERRIQAIVNHLLRPYIVVEVAAAPWPLSRQEKIVEQEYEKAGWGFVERFLDEVPRGELLAAIDWVSENHKSHPYQGIDAEDAVAIIRGQLLDFDSWVGISNLEPVALVA